MVRGYAHRTCGVETAALTISRNGTDGNGPEHLTISRNGTDDTDRTLKKAKG